MKGLILKDLYIIKSTALLTVIFLIILCFGFSFIIESSAILTLGPVLTTMMLFMNITFIDDNSKWNKNVITMPVSRSQIVGEKYLMYIFLSLIGTFSALLICSFLVC